jgi:hypothetical protein
MSEFYSKCRTIRDQLTTGDVKQYRKLRIGRRSGRGEDVDC